MTSTTQLQLHLELGTSHWWLVETKRLAADALRRKLPVGSSILDAGAGVSGLRHLLEPEFSVVSLDISEDALRLAAGAKCLVRGSVEQLPFRSEAFDGIASLDVLFHMAVGDDHGAAREAARVLRPGGLLVLNVPAYPWMLSAHDVRAGTARRYTRRHLKTLLRQAGLTPERVSYRNTILFPLALVRRKVLRSTGSDLGPVHPFLNWIFTVILQAERAWLRRWTLPFGLSVFAVARKPR